MVGLGDLFSAYLDGKRLANEDNWNNLLNYNKVSQQNLANAYDTATFSPRVNDVYNRAYSTELDNTYKTMSMPSRLEQDRLNALITLSRLFGIDLDNEVKQRNNITQDSLIEQWMKILSGTQGGNDNPNYASMDVGMTSLGENPEWFSRNKPLFDVKEWINKRVGYNPNSPSLLDILNGSKSTPTSTPTSASLPPPTYRDYIKEIPYYPGLGINSFTGEFVNLETGEVIDRDLIEGVF